MEVVASGAIWDATTAPVNQRTASATFAVRLADGFVPAEHTLEVRVNGELRQRSALDDFIFPIPRALAHISHVMSLLPGDVVLTGTPAGVGPLRAGDLVEVAIDGIGCLRNPVVRAPRTPE